MDSNIWFGNFVYNINFILSWHNMYINIITFGNIKIILLKLNYYKNLKSDFIWQLYLGRLLDWLIVWLGLFFMKHNRPTQYVLSFVFFQPFNICFLFSLETKSLEFDFQIHHSNSSDSHWDLSKFCRLKLWYVSNRFLNSVLSLIQYELFVFKSCIYDSFICRGRCFGL